MRNRLGQIVAYEPPVGNVDLDLLDRLAHTSDYSVIEYFYNSYFTVRSVVFMIVFLLAVALLFILPGHRMTNEKIEISVK